MQAINFNAVDMGMEIANFRAKSIASENAATPLARSILAGLLTGAATVDSVTIAMLAAYGNPKSPKGKVSETISGLRYAVGGDAARKTLETIFKVADNAKLSPAIRDIVVAFVLKEKDAPKALKGLDQVVKAAVTAHNEEIGAQAKQEAEAAHNEEIGAQAKQEAEAATPRPVTLSEVADMLYLMMERASDLELEVALPSLAKLGDILDIWRESAQAAMDGEPMAKAA